LRPLQKGAKPKISTSHTTVGREWSGGCGGGGGDSSTTIGKTRFYKLSRLATQFAWQMANKYS